MRRVRYETRKHKQISARWCHRSQVAGRFRFEVDATTRCLADGAAAAVDQTLRDLNARMQRGDIIIDGGNSHYVDDTQRANELKPKGIHYVDAGKSGGVWGSERGYCLMKSGVVAATATALLKEPSLKSYAGRVSDSGEGRWTIKAAIDEAVPAPGFECRTL